MCMETTIGGFSNYLHSGHLLGKFLFYLVGQCRWSLGLASPEEALYKFKISNTTTVPCFKMFSKVTFWFNVTILSYVLL